MRGSLSTFAVAAALLSPAVVTSQQNAPPPLWLSIHREVVKPGKEGAHAKLEVAWARALEAAKFPDVMIGMGAMSGATEMWFMQGYPTMAEMQTSNTAYDASPVFTAVDQKFRPQEAEYLTSATNLIARFRPELSYDAGNAMPGMRYMTVQRIVVRPGHGAEFDSARKIIKAAHEKVKAKDGFALYQVTSGAPAGTYLLMGGRQGLADLDADPHGPDYGAALGPNGQKTLNDLLIAYEASAATDLFQVNPEISIVPKTWADADPYWKPKPVKVAAKP